MSNCTAEGLLTLLDGIDIEELQKAIGDITPEPVVYHSTGLLSKGTLCSTSSEQHRIRYSLPSQAFFKESPRSPLSHLNSARKPFRPPSYDPNRSRNSRAREILLLRRDLASMHRQLQWLHASIVRQDLGMMRQPAEGNANTREASLWERVASRQRAERRLAECRNQQLKRLVGVHHRVAKHLEKLIQTLATQAVGMTIPGFRRQAETAERLLRQVDESYAEADYIVDEMSYVPYPSDSTTR